MNYRLNKLILGHRKEIGEKQSSYAQKLGISKQDLCDIERFRKNVGLKRAVQFSQNINIPMEKILECVISDMLDREGLEFSVKVDKKENG